MLRALFERTTHVIVLPRRLPPPFREVRIYTSSEGGLRYLRPRLTEVDPSLLRLASEIVRPGQYVWDIGANLGLFSFAAAEAAGLGGRVLSVEADISLVRLLRRSAELNHGGATVDVFSAAVASELGVSRLNIARRNRSTNYLEGFGTSQTGGVRASELVPTVTLDWLASHFGQPDVIKIDVEEAEVAVLLGGADVLSRLPAIICEVAGRNAAEVTEVLNAHGYCLYDGELPRGRRSTVPVAPPNTLALSPSAESKLVTGAI